MFCIWYGMRAILSIKLLFSQQIAKIYEPPKYLPVESITETKWPICIYIIIPTKSSEMLYERMKRPLFLYLLRTNTKYYPSWDSE